MATVKLPCVIRIITNTNELIFIMEFGWRVSLDIIFQLFSQHFNFFLSTFGLFFLIFWTFFLHFELFLTFWRFFSKCMMTKEPFSQVALTLFCRIVQDEVSVWWQSIQLQAATHTDFSLFCSFLCHQGAAHPAWVNFWLILTSRKSWLQQFITWRFCVHF